MKQRNASPIKIFLCRIICHFNWPCIINSFDITLSWVFLRDTISVLGTYESKCLAGESPATFVSFFGASKCPTMVKIELGTRLIEYQYLTRIYFLGS